MKKVCFVLAACAVVSAALVGCGSNSSTESTGSAATSTAAVSSDAEAESKQNVNVEMQTFKDWEIQPKSIRFETAFQEGNTPKKAKDGNTFVIIDTDIKNLDSKVGLFLSDASSLEYIEAAIVYDGSYTYTDISGLTGFDNNLSGMPVQPLESKSGYILFEVPNEVAASDKSLTLKINFKSEFEEESSIEFPLR